MDSIRGNRARLACFLFKLLLVVVIGQPSAAAPPVVTAPPSHAEIPQLFRQSSFTADTLANAVNHYVSIGKVAAINELSSLVAHVEVQGRHATNQSSFNLNERVGWVCGILFLPKGKQPLRQPRFGWLAGPLVGSRQWPLFPVIASGKSYFVFTKIEHLTSRPESIIHYLRYCRSHGTFRQKPISVPTRTEALHDLELLRRSREWQSLPWPENMRGAYVSALVFMVSQQDILARIRPQALDIRL